MGNSLKGTKSHDNFKGAFAGESQANRRYLYFARRRISRGSLISEGCFAIRRRQKQATRSGTWIS
jgi:Rubrerythrin